MWKVSVLLLIAFIGASSAQNVTLNCEFYLTFYDEYTCILEGIEVLDESLNITFAGEHLGNRTNDDVELVLIAESNTPFIIQELFMAFPNVIELEIFWSNLTSINLPENTKLEALLLLENNITRIANSTFITQNELWYLWMIDNNIQEIDEDAFMGLQELQYLVLIENRIQELAPRTFHPLTNVEVIDLEGNLLTSIGEELFSANRNLGILFLESNQINEISPRFAVNLRDSLIYVNFAGNRCISRSFDLEDDQDWALMNGQLQTCFNNFNGTIPETRRVTLEFSGNMVITDGNGNIIARV